MFYEDCGFIMSLMSLMNQISLTLLKSLLNLVHLTIYVLIPPGVMVSRLHFASMTLGLVSRLHFASMTLRRAHVLHSVHIHPKTLRLRL